jgi:hypothetical protein
MRWFPKTKQERRLEGELTKSVTFDQSYECSSQYIASYHCPGLPIIMNILSLIQSKICKAWSVIRIFPHF